MFDIIEKIVTKKDYETININQANGKILGRNIISKIDVPHFNKSAMDGFAVIAKDTIKASKTNPKKFKIIDSIIAGIVPKNELKSGECIEITTGAPLPKNASAVLKAEFTEKKNNEIKYYDTCKSGENIIKIGSDVKKGDLLFEKGTKLNPRIIGVISSIGISRIKVMKQPVISYFSTGNEVLSVGKKLSPGSIFDINTRTIVDTLREHGCIVNNLGIIKDDLEKIKKTILSKIDESDIILLSGGSSLGGSDFMVEAVMKIGKVLFHGILSKPGKPLLIGKVKGKLLIGLPGCPTSAILNTYSLVLPVIYKMMGSVLKRRITNARLSRKIDSKNGRFDFMPVKLKVNSDNERIATPVMNGLNSITTMAQCDGYVTIHEKTVVLNKNQDIEVYLY